MTDINKTTSQDVMYAVVKAGLSSIPLAGASASELLGLLVASPLEKRRNEWLIEVGKRLQKLENENRLLLDDLRSNDIFIDTVFQATTYDLKTSEKEKLTAFRNTILNVAINSDIDKTKSQIFLSLLDSFTVWHIKILSFINDPKGWYKATGKRLPSEVHNHTTMFDTFVDNFLELKNNDELIDLIWRDLKNAGFHRIPEVKSMISSDTVLVEKTTELGKEFLQFITFQE
jgi:hypothetical protein